MERTLGREQALEGYAARAARVLREEGMGALAGRLRRRLTNALVARDSVTFFVRELADVKPAVDAPGLSVRQLYASEREAIQHGSPAPWGTLLARFQAGDLCFGALDASGRAVHTRWVTLTRARIPELALDFVPGPDAAYFYDGHTRPDARRLGADGAVRAAIFEYLRTLGRARVFSYVRDDNPAGLRAAARAQACAGSASTLRVGRARPWVFTAPTTPLRALLQRPPARESDDARARAADWRRWFEGWLQAPVATRSIGFHELPAEAFEAMAAHIAGTLALDSARDLVLDVGCDSALVSSRVAPHCRQLVGVDFIPGLLLDAQRCRRDSGADDPRLSFGAADGRRLPFAAHTFAKAYCSGVIHTLPSHADGIAMVLELVRVTRPGGHVLVAAVPDARKRWRARRAAWAEGGLGERVRIVAAALLPDAVRRVARRLAARVAEPPLRYLEYDLRRLQRLLAARGIVSTPLHYPSDFWSRDFRETRSNLLIEIPAATPATRVSAVA